MRTREALVLGVIVYTAAVVWLAFQACEAVHLSPSAGRVAAVTINLMVLVGFFILLIGSAAYCVYLIWKSAGKTFPGLLIPAAVLFFFLFVMAIPLFSAWMTNTATPDSGMGKYVTDYPPHTLEAIGWFFLLFLLFMVALFLVTGWRPKRPFFEHKPDPDRPSTSRSSGGSTAMHQQSASHGDGF